MKKYDKDVINDNKMVILHIKDNYDKGCYVGVFESIDKFISLTKIAYPLDTFEIKNENNKLLVERYFRGKELISRHNYTYDYVKQNGNFCYFK